MMGTRALTGRLSPKPQVVALLCVCVGCLLLLLPTASVMRKEMGTPGFKGSRFPIEQPSPAVKPVEDGSMLLTEQAVNLASGAILSQRYQIIDKIGGRAEGEAFEAWDVASERSVVAKCYKEKKASACIKELVALTALIASPLYGAVYGPYLDSFQHGNRQCIIQPYLGANLERVMQQARRPFSVDTVIEVLQQILRQLEAAHNLQVLHKDMKTDNIVIMDRQQQLLEGTFKVQLIDWGQAALAAAPRVINGWNFHPYHPPERVLQLPASYPLDVWGLGHVALQMLTGSRLFPGVLVDKKIISTYFDELEMISGCIPADVLPPNWKHESEEELQMELTVRNRIKSCAQQELKQSRIFYFLTELASSKMMPSSALAEFSDLLDQMLMINPAARITAAAALAHPVFSTSSIEASNSLRTE